MLNNHSAGRTIPSLFIGWPQYDIDIITGRDAIHIYDVVPSDVIPEKGTYIEKCIVTRIDSEAFHSGKGVHIGKSATTRNRDIHRRATEIRIIEELYTQHLTIRVVRILAEGEVIVTIVLQPREFRLLEFLMKHESQVVTRTMLLEHVWDYHFDPQTNVIDVHISRLRQKIDKGFAHPLLNTVRGAGYMLNEPE